MKNAKKILMGGLILMFSSALWAASDNDSANNQQDSGQGSGDIANENMNN